MSDKTYDILKYIAQVALPALIVLYAALAGYWHWPYTEAITGSLAAIDVFLGKLLMIKSDQFFTTHLIIDDEEEGDEDGND